MRGAIACPACGRKHASQIPGKNIFWAQWHRPKILFRVLLSRRQEQRFCPKDMFSDVVGLAQQCKSSNSIVFSISKLLQNTATIKQHTCDDPRVRTPRNYSFGVMFNLSDTKYSISGVSSPPSYQRQSSSSVLKTL